MLDNTRTRTCTFAAMHNDFSSTKLNPRLGVPGALVVVVVSLERQVQAA
jgi:hypothetical protein